MSQVIKYEIESPYTCPNEMFTEEDEANERKKEMIHELLTDDDFEGMEKELEEEIKVQPIEDYVEHYTSPFTGLIRVFND